MIALLSTVLASCQSTRSHFDGEVWEGGFSQFTDHPEQWVPVATGLVVTPLLFAVDKSTSTESVEDQFFNTNTTTGDALALGLGLSPILLGAVEGVVHDDTRHLEVTSEAMALTFAQTEVLKLVTNRQRPNGTAQDSFPSGHTSFAFAGATLLARWWGDEHDGSWLGYVLYVPAAYVGLTRLEGDRHYLSDIVFGATLGIFTAHMVWNAHYGDATHPGLFGQRVDVSIQPVLEPHQIGVGLTLSF